MQKLVFINGTGKQIDLTSGNYGITNWEGFSNANLNIQTQQVPFEDGGVFLDALIEQRDISVIVAIQDNNNLELRYQKKRELISALNPKLGEGTLIYTNNFLSRQIKAVPQIPLFENKNSNDAGTLKATVSFTCCSPYWEDIEENETAVDSESLKNIINEGDENAGTEMIIIPQDNQTISIENTTNDTEIKIQGNLNLPIKLDLKLGKKTATKISYENKMFFIPFKMVKQSGNKLFGITNNKAYVSDNGRNWECVYYNQNVTFADCEIVEKDNTVYYFITTLNLNKLFKAVNNFTFTEKTVTSAYKVKYNADEDVLLLYGYGNISYSSDFGETITDVTNASDLPRTVRAFTFTLNNIKYIGSFTDNLNYYGIKENGAIDSILSNLGTVKDFIYFSYKQMYVVSVENQKIKYSADLTSWNEASLLNNVAELVEVNTKLYGVGTGTNNIYFSTTLDKWQGIDIGFFSGGQGGEGNGTIIINNIFYLYNLYGWWNSSQKVIGKNGNITDFCIYKDSYIAIKDNKVYKSTDLFVFEEIYEADETNLYFVDCANNNVVIGSDNGYIYKYNETSFEKTKVWNFVAKILSMEYTGKYYCFVVKDTVNNIYATMFSEDLEHFAGVSSYPSDLQAEIRKVNNINYIMESTLHDNDEGVIRVYNIPDQSWFSEDRIETHNSITADFNQKNEIILALVDNIYLYNKNINDGSLSLNKVKTLDEPFTHLLYDNYLGYFLLFNDNKIMFTTDGEYVHDLTEIFFINPKKKDGKIVSVYQSINELKEYEVENIISMIKNMDFKLNVGDNIIQVITEIRECLINIKYRQKYIGV